MKNQNSMTDIRHAGAWAIIYCPTRKSFLFGKRSKVVNNPGQWNLFGGRSAIGETPRRTLLRELSEETGLTPPSNRLRHLTSVTGAIIKGIAGDSRPLRKLDYFVIIAGYEIEASLNFEHSEYRWFKQTTLPRVINPPTAIAHSLGLFQMSLAAYR